MLNEFHKSAKSKDGLNSSCRVCIGRRGHKWYMDNRRKALISRKRWKRENPDKVKEIRSRYRFHNALKSSISNAEKKDHTPCTATVEEITEAFTGFCQNPRCGVPEMECKRRLCLDHDHETGKFRGWLCGECNKAAGLLRNSADTTFGLAEYLESFFVSLTQFER